MFLRHATLVVFTIIVAVINAPTASAHSPKSDVRSRSIAPANNAGPEVRNSHDRECRGCHHLSLNADWVMHAALIASFMLLRVSVVLTSLQDKSSTLLWSGLAFVCFSRCIADDVGWPLKVGDVIDLAMIGGRETLHCCGLHVALKYFALDGQDWPFPTWETILPRQALESVTST
mmetsp:Transcript_22773/g.53137  ORF Transcript_22773/g.53137 Transcript_22773/m.53137 type:complete len:175 (+) Transcript_22773:68-592(+)